MKKIVLYGVEVGSKGDFDGFPFERNDAFDQVLITDNPALKGDNFDNVLFDCGGIDPARASRNPKLMPHKYFPEYEWSIYVDSNAIIRERPDAIVARYENDQTGFLAMVHPDRDCIFDEAEFLIAEDYDTEAVIRDQMRAYRDRGFPTNFGMIMGTFLVRRHNLPHVKRLGEAWYEHVLRYAKRDQLSFPFVSWMQGFAWTYLEGTIHDNAHVSWPRRPRNQRVTAAFDPDLYAKNNPDVAASGLPPQEHYLARRRAGLPVKGWRKRERLLGKIANKHGTDKGTLAGAAANYADAYEEHLRRFRSKPGAILILSDFSAQNAEKSAATLRMWAEYLPSVEITTMSRGGDPSSVDIGGLTAICGDVASIVDELFNRAPEGFDVIIDDGPRAASSRQTALSELFRLLKPGGLYFLEDAHISDSEEPSLPTSKVLKGLSRGKIFPTEHIDAGALRDIRAELRDILFYDSWSRELDRIPRDALAVLRKAIS